MESNAVAQPPNRAAQYKRLSKGFMGQQWDGGDVAFRPETWAEVLRVLKPGAHLVAFSGTRTYHRMACAIEDAGFEIRDQLAWTYGSGFPKSHNQPGGWGTALKPAWEPICLARKPLDGTVAGNVLAHGTGAINIDGCRIGDGAKKWETPRGGIWATDSEAKAELVDNPLGRWPANIIHDGSDEVLAGFPADAKSGGAVSGNEPSMAGGGVALGNMGRVSFQPHADSGSAARFFYSAQPSEEELLLSRAKAILQSWHSELANTADSSSMLSNEAAAFVLSGAATWALPEGSQLSNTITLSTSVTPIELRLISESFIVAILISASECWPEWRRARPIPNGCHVQFAETPRQTDTTTITISHWKSNGSAAPVTFSITPLNSELGAKGLNEPKRFHYAAKATTEERGEGNNHPTVKPINLMRWLCRLVTPIGGTVLDPFAGSGSTLIAADAEQFHAIGCELSPAYAAIAERRVRDAAGMFAEVRAA